MNTRLGRDMLGANTQRGRLDYQRRNLQVKARLKINRKNVERGHT